MRLMLVAVTALGLSGCADMDFFGDAPSSTAPDTTGTAAQPPGEAAPVQAPAASAQAAITTPSAHCTHLARQRASDAAYAGEDEDTQQAVYDRTYADCAAWDAKHGS